MRSTAPKLGDFTAKAQRSLRDAKVGVLNETRSAEVAEEIAEKKNRRWTQMDADLSGMGFRFSLS
jgi:hypothetical protein